jgi:hypothetical protein
MSTGKPEIKMRSFYIPLFGIALSVSLLGTSYAQTVPKAQQAAPIHDQNDAIPASQQSAQINAANQQLSQAAQGQISAAQLVSETMKQTYNLGLTTGLQVQAKVVEMSQEMQKLQDENAKLKQKCGSACDTPVASTAPPAK